MRIALACLFSIAALLTASCATERGAAPRNIKVYTWDTNDKGMPTQMRSEIVLDNDGNVISHREWDKDGNELQTLHHIETEAGNQGPKPRNGGGK